jgi:hypothetical protein
MLALRDDTDSDALAPAGVDVVVGSRKVRRRIDARHGRQQRWEYAPSVLVTTGRLILTSLGEDILEFWGDVRTA